MRPLLPALSLLLYASLLLLARHHPAVAGHWQAWLAGPRLAVGAWALWVAMSRRGGREKDEGREAEATRPHAPPVVSCDARPETISADPLASGSLEPTAPRALSAKEATHYRFPLPPSTTIGIILALSAAASVVGGLWAADWGGVRVLSAVAWLIVAAIGCRAR